ncbi:MAG: ACP S-malonyltransferase [Prevotellaceae bacterium]|nr:ACP S-malonyltransferase [Prevotellaceae bacterium]
MTAFVFPGQGAQYPEMGKELYKDSTEARRYFEHANEILNFNITEIMFNGSDEQLRQTAVTQPAVFLHSVVAAFILGKQITPDMVAGHSLGEFSALVAAGALAFEDGLRLVSKRAKAMQRACELVPSTMAAILGLDDEEVEAICLSIKDDIVVPANYNCPGQIVISGSMDGVARACELARERGAKRALQLSVGGAFHSPLMKPAAAELEAAITETPFNAPKCPVYQNVNASPQTDAEVIKQNLIEQLTAPVRWTQTAKNMIADGATRFYELGPGDVLKGLIKKINAEVELI